MAAGIQIERQVEMDQLVQYFVSKTTLRVGFVKQLFDACLKNHKEAKNSLSSLSKDWIWKIFYLNDPLDRENEVISWLYEQVFDKFNYLELNAMDVNKSKDVNVEQVLSKFNEVTNILLKTSTAESLPGLIQAIRLESVSFPEEQCQITDSDSLERILGFRLHTSKIKDFLKQCSQIPVKEINKLISEQKYQKVLGYIWATEEENLNFLRALRPLEHVPLLYELGLAEAKELLRKAKASSTESIAIGPMNLSAIKNSNMDLASDFCRKVLPLFAYAFCRAYQDASCLASNQQSKAMISKMNADYLEQLNQLCKYELGISLNRIKLFLFSENEENEISILEQQFMHEHFMQFVKEGAFKEDLPHPSWLGESKEKAAEIYIERLGFVKSVSKEIDRVFHPSAVLSGSLREIDMFERIQSVVDGKKL